jgi:L-lactate dehydrogenase (cytochrome)
VEEVGRGAPSPPWFQLYMIKDRGYMEALMARAQAFAAPVLMFTVDLPVPGTRYRDVRSGLNGGLDPLEQLGRAADGLTHPDWLWDVMVRGRPTTFGNLAPAIPNARGAGDFWVWVRENFDASVTWADLEWVRQRWKGPIVIKGVLDVEDARAALDAGADGVVVSNHGGRQLDGAAASISALPAIAEAVGDRMTVLMDGGVRSGLDVVKALALGARACLIGRAWAMPLAARGGSGVAHMLELMRQEIATALALTGCREVGEAGPALLA